MLVGSSMGAWLSVSVAEERPERVVSLLLVASAPDFIRRVYQDQMPSELFQRLMDSGEVVYTDRGYGPWPASKQLYDEGCSLELLSRPGFKSTAGGVESPPVVIFRTNRRGLSGAIAALPDG